MLSPADAIRLRMSYTSGSSTILWDFEEVGQTVLLREGMTERPAPALEGAAREQRGAAGEH